MIKLKPPKLLSLHYIKSRPFPGESGRLLILVSCYFTGQFICSLLQKTFTSVSPWKLDNETKEYEILTLLSESLKVVQTWTSACKSLTETYWPNYALHPWNGKPYIPLFCQKFESRLKEVLN